MSDRIRPKGRTIFLYLLLPVGLFLFSIIIPMIQAFYYSFFKWNGGTTMTPIGFKNYIDLVQDKVFWQAFGHNIFLVAACVIGQIGIAFLFVMILSGKSVKAKNLHRTLAFFPSTISAVAIGIIWRIIFDYKYGILNWAFGALGLESLQKVWLNDAQNIMVVVSIPLIWQYIGYYMVILLSAISSIDTEIFEVAELDGANAWQRAIHITLPLIRNTIMVCVTLCIAGNMKAFDHIYTMTKGGPGTASNVMAMYAYDTSFKYNQMGYGSAISIGILILSLCTIGLSQLVINRIGRGKVEKA